MLTPVPTLARIRARVTLCWLALLLIRVAETATGRTWNSLGGELQRLHLGIVTSANGTFAHRTQLTAGHKAVLKPSTSPSLRSYTPRARSLLTSANPAA